MTELALSIAGHRARTAAARVSFKGPWLVDLDLDEAVALSGRVEVKIGPLALSGTIEPSASGTFALASKYRVIAGARGWHKTVARDHLHNDAGVKRSAVLARLAAAVKESITLLPGADAVLGVDFVREAAPASRVLEQVLGDTPWWVGYDGATLAGPRPSTEITGAYDLLNFDARHRVATLACDDPRAITIGSVLRSPRLGAPVTVRELEISATASALRITAWGQEGNAGRSRLLRALSLAARESAPKATFLAPYRYRVFQMSAERVELQAVRKLAGLPDAIPVTIHPGMAGLSAQLTPGSLVLVSFIEGDPTLPIVTHFEPKGGAGFLPVSLALDAVDLVRIGATATAVTVGPGTPAKVGRVGDAVAIGQLTVSGVGGVVLQFTPAGGGAPGPISASVDITGVISEGSSLFRSA